MSENVRIEKFRTLELNERNVNTLFNRCLPNEYEVQNPFLCYPTQVLIPEITGRKSQEVSLSKEKINANKNTILYLLGQIESFHSDREVLTLEEGLLRYDGVIWTKDYQVLFKLYHLCLSSDFLFDFSLVSEKLYALKNPVCVPTLSPKDPNFPAWWEEHKSEWE